MIKHLKELQTWTGTTVEAIHCDNGTEYKNTTLKNWTEKHGIVLQFSSAYFANENGQAERTVRTIRDTMKALLVTSKLNMKFWDWAADYAVHISNALPRPAQEHSPFRLFYLRHPDLKRFRVFSARGYVVQKREGKKVKLHGTKIRFIGLSARSKSYRVWKECKKKAQTCRDIQLDEKALLKTDQDTLKLPLKSSKRNVQQVRSSLDKLLGLRS